MAETIYNSRPEAVLSILKTPVHVPDVIITIKTTLDKLANSGDNLIDPAVLLTQESNAQKLSEKQEAMSGSAADRTDQRNDAYMVCFTDYKGNMMEVQKASNALDDFNLAAALIKRNGYELKKEHVPLVSPPISIKRKKRAETTIIAKVKAPNTTKAFSIDWDYSYDNGATWHHLNSTPVCDREIRGLEELKRVIVRARFNIGYNDPLDWMISNGINL